VQLGCDLATDTISYGCPGVAGTVVAVVVGVPVVATSCVLNVYKNDVTLVAQQTLTTAGGYVGGTAQSVTLVTTPTSLRVAATDILSANWDVTTAGSYVGGGCTVWIEPDVW
jgi:hypothetical protein